MTKSLILIAEDEPNIALSLSFILEKAGYEIDTVTDGSQVENKANATRPDALILDIMLPNKSGFDVLRGIRTNSAIKDMPILILSARGQENDRARAKELGANDYLIKPFSNQELVRRMDELIKSSHA